MDDKNIAALATLSLQQITAVSAACREGATIRVGTIQDSRYEFGFALFDVPESSQHMLREAGFQIVWLDYGEMVWMRRHEEPDIPMLTPDEVLLIRQRLKL